MAFSQGKESVESNIKRYIGVAASYVLAVNPDAKKLSEIFGREVTTEREYKTTIQQNDKEYKAVRVSFVLKPDPEKYNGIVMTVNHDITLSDAYAYNKDKSKVQVIDKYGQSAWATVAEAKAKTVPVYKNGKKASIDADFRPARYGEVELTEFIINYLNISSPRVYDAKTGIWSQAANLADCEARFEEEDLKKILSGNFSVLKDIVAKQPNNRIKVLIGVTTSDDGKLYQRTYRRTFKIFNNKFTDVEKEITDLKLAGKLSNVEYKFCNLTEYAVAPTDVSQNAVPSEAPAPTVEDLPFGDGLPE